MILDVAEVAEARRLFLIMREEVKAALPVPTSPRAAQVVGASTQRHIDKHVLFHAGWWEMTQSREPGLHASLFGFHDHDSMRHLFDVAFRPRLTPDLMKARTNNFDCFQMYGLALMRMR